MTLKNPFPDLAKLEDPRLVRSVVQNCKAGNGRRALSQVERALSASPTRAGLHVLHAWVLRETGDPGAAAGAYAQAAQLRPNDGRLWFGMGECLADAGENGGAFQAFAQTLSVDPNHADAFFRLADLLYRNGYFGKLRERLEACPSKFRKDPRWFIFFGSANFELGDGKLLCEPPPEFRNAFTRLSSLAALRIRAMVYDPDVTGAQLLEATQNWDRRFGPVRPADIPLNDPRPDRPLRIGMVNTRMRRHNVGMQQHALLRHRPPLSEYSLHLYGVIDHEDAITTELKGMADHFVSVAGMSAAEAAKRIRADNIDILIDFNEYTNDGRLDIFCQRAAAIQVHYYGNAVTTGLRAMDYRISDSVSEPPGDADHVSAEKIIRLGPGYHLYTPPPDPAPLRFDSPVKERGFVTFGGIHHLAKYNDRVLECYRRVLDALPTARLVLARKHFEDADAVAFFSEKLKRSNLPMDRITLVGDYGAIASLAFWQEVDCVLDTFPFAGDATAVESLYAGVPMITFMGDRISSRRSGSILTRIGCEELIAHSEDEYVAKAIALAKDPDRLDHYRATLHKKMAASTICTHAESATAVFRELRRIWKQTIVSRNANPGGGVIGTAD